MLEKHSKIEIEALDSSVSKSANFMSSLIYRMCPTPLWRMYNRIIKFFVLYKSNESDFRSTMRFISNKNLGISFIERIIVIYRYNIISRKIICAHTQDEMIRVAESILSFPKDVQGCIVEAGCFKGGSTAKMSIAASLCNRKLLVFDSFEGLPENNEEHLSFTGYKADFGAGNYAGTLEDVTKNVSEFGEPDCCEFKKGWFCDTLPTFSDDVCVAYLDVDLVQSTKDCLKYIHKRLLPAGVIYSQDGHLLLIQELLEDDGFWRDEVSCEKPAMPGLGTKKLVQILPV